MPSRDRSSKPEFDPKAFLGRIGRGVALEKYQKNQQVHLQGDPADAVGFIRKGSVKATISSGHGKEAIIGIFRQGQFFGECGLGNSKVRTATFVALEECLLTLISKETMLSMLGSEPVFSKFFLDQLLSRNNRLEGDLVDQLLHSSEQRLARLLLLLAEFDQDGDKPIPLSLNQEALAEMIGTTRSRVSTFMNKFREKGFISYDSHGRIQVHAALLLSVLASRSP
jgi:CRP/FNR family transcriptional regulator, cyclic AMP receptor protein